MKYIAQAPIVIAAETADDQLRMAKRMGKTVALCILLVGALTIAIACIML